MNGNAPIGSQARKPWSSIPPFLAILLIFSLAYSQAPLYSSNQNQYFLHGAAGAGVGELQQDWLANTTDPTPVFSMLVQLTISLGFQPLFYLYYLLLLAIFIYSLWGIIQEVLQPDWTQAQQHLALTLLVGMYSFAMRFFLSRLLGQEWRFIFEGGFAGQRLLGTVLQPSTFGVLLLLGLLLFLRRKPVPAVISVVLAATVHPTYLLNSGLLVLGFLIASFRQTHGMREPLQLGLLALVLVSPTLLHTWSHFQPTSPRLTELAAQILVEERIPNHVLIGEWFNVVVLVQIGFTMLAIVKYRTHPIAVIMTVVSAFILLLTFLQVLTGNDRLALLFPWRPSALLVPVASSLLLGWAAEKIFTAANHLLDRNATLVICASWILLTILALIGAASFIYDLNRKRSAPSQSMMEFVRSNLSSGDRFFIPPKLQDFRLVTGAPVLVDFKSIPYADTEVIEWHSRLMIAQNFFRDSIHNINCVQIEKARKHEELTHVILARPQFGLDCPIFSELLYSDGEFEVYRLSATD